jgi:hypothetical protein
VIGLLFEHVEELAQFTGEGAMLPQSIDRFMKR